MHHVAATLLLHQFRTTLLHVVWSILIVIPGYTQDVEFIDLLNGSDLTGWVEMGDPGAFVADDGTLWLKDPNNYPNWLRSEDQYENFILELEYQTPGWAEGGVYLHAPLHGDPVESGMKIHLRHDRTEEGARSTGAIYDVRAPIAIANEVDGAWNRMRIHMDWPRLRVWLNGILIQDLNAERSDALRHRLRRGYIGFEDCGTQFRFRSVRIKELPPSEASWTVLFNGSDLEGWEMDGDADWEIADEKIVASGGDGVLQTDATFSSFEFQTYFKTDPHANGGIFYRLMDRDDQPGHYEIQIYNVPTATNPTGSIYGIVPARDAGCRSDEWCLMQLISDGAYSRVLINGQTVAEGWSLALPDTGRVAIQNHSQSTIEYKNVRIKPLRDGTFPSGLPR